MAWCRVSEMIQMYGSRFSTAARRTKARVTSVDLALPRGPRMLSFRPVRRCASDECISSSWPASQIVHFGWLEAEMVREEIVADQARTSSVADNLSRLDCRRIGPTSGFLQ